MSENRKLYIADWHYAHANILAFDNRPFKTVEEMNKELVKRWNAAVDPGDTVYVLGDMFWCKAQEALPVLQSLNGQKFLIKGNHDRCNDGKFIKSFVKVQSILKWTTMAAKSCFVTILFHASRIISMGGITCTVMFINHLSMK